MPEQQKPWPRALAFVVVVPIVIAPWAAITYVAMHVSPLAGTMYLAAFAATERTYGVAQAAALFILTGRPTRMPRLQDTKRSTG